VKVVPIGKIATPTFSARIRDAIIQPEYRRVRMSRLDHSVQSRDFTIPANCQGFGRIHHFRRDAGADWPENPLPIDPAAKFLGLGRLDELQAQVFQVSGCSWRCWYCFVDDELLSASPKESRFWSPSELLDAYATAPIKARIIDLSGGQPDLVPELAVWLNAEISARGWQNDVYLWSDDNLSNDYMWRFLTKAQIAVLAHSPNYGRVGCFKGFDKQSFSFNTRASHDGFAVQFSIARRLVESDFDLYAYATLTAPSDEGIHQKIRYFVERLRHDVHPLFPLRLVPLKIFEFSPTKHRTHGDFQYALSVQLTAMQAWREELRTQFGSELLGRPIWAHSLR
jgi:uncharacterized Fe-S cluster-containing radical SAM superfamily protein